MPLGEIEKHPYLQEGYITGSKSLILGTFPVYWCTDLDTNQKLQLRNEKGAFRFFYGSHRSSFWNLYANYIDNSLDKPFNSQAILESLVANNISISDLILSCERMGVSALDSDLKHKVWNVEGLNSLLKQEKITRILCTSKYVLSNLSSRIIKNNNLGIIDDIESIKFKNDFITRLDGDTNHATGTIAQVYKINGRKVEALAIPSPGSPYRQLSTFGFVHGENKIYANKYFKNAFTWLHKQ
jgi:hypothetical protein